MARVAVASAVVAGVGATLVLSELRWFKRVRLVDRLMPFAGSTARPKTTPALSTFKEALAPLTSSFGERLAKVFGVNDDLATRLARAEMDPDIATFRLRQFSYAAGALGGALLLVLGIRPPLAFTGLLLLGAPLLAFLLLEQYVITRAQKHQQRLFAELPVITEQLAMLLSAGYSLGAALNRLAARNQGTAARGLRTVSDRVRHGLTTTEALNEWADVAGIDELRRVVAVLALSGETSDLGRLVSDEAKTIRREAQRRLSETIEKRSQQVWVPVTVATLVPGVIFLVIPFLQALQLFSGT